MVLRILGHVFCLSAPKRHSARTLAITALALVGSSAALSLLAMFIGMIEGGLQASSPFGAGGASTGFGAVQAFHWCPTFMSVLAGLLNAAGSTSFCFFCTRQQALAVRAADLSRSIVWFTITFISCVVVSFLGLVVMLLLVWDKFAGSLPLRVRFRNMAGRGGGSNTEPVMGGVFYYHCWRIALLAIFIWHIVILFQVPCRHYQADRALSMRRFPASRVP